MSGGSETRKRVGKFPTLRLPAPLLQRCASTVLRQVRQPFSKDTLLQGLRLRQVAPALCPYTTYRGLAAFERRLTWVARALLLPMG